MLNLDKMVEIGISIPNATDISAYLSNVGYIADFTADDLVDGVTVPTNKLMVLQSADDVVATFKNGTKYNQDLTALFTQKNNTKPNQGRVNKVFVFQKTTENTFGDAFDAFFALKADWAQLVISSKVLDDIKSVAARVQLQNRLFIAQTAETVATTDLSAYPNVKILHSPDTDSVAAALACVLANSNLGSVGDLYTVFGGINPTEYSSADMSAFDEAKVGYYTTVNAINGGGVEHYGKAILYGNKQADGEITKRRYIRYTIDLLLKAKVLDFLGRKLSYQESSNNILEGDLKSVLINCQSNDLIVQDSEDSKGFYLDCMQIAKIKKYYNANYLNQEYRVNGWYIDALTGTKVYIDLLVNPSDAEKAAFEL